MIKIGIIGLGRVGSQHLERLLDIDYFTVVGCFDTDATLMQQITEDFDVPCFDNVDDLMDQCDAIDIVTPADFHYYYAEKAIKKGKHIFVEKPITNDLEEAKVMVELVREAGIKFQVGHIERFNPAFLALQHQPMNPMLIEAHRLSYFEAHNNDVPRY
jgi:predicted dehydrogenase